MIYIEQESHAIPITPRCIATCTASWQFLRKILKAGDRFQFVRMSYALMPPQRLTNSVPLQTACKTFSRNIRDTSARNWRRRFPPILVDGIRLPRPTVKHLPMNSLMPSKGTTNLPHLHALACMFIMIENIFSHTSIYRIQCCIECHFVENMTRISMRRKLQSFISSHFFIVHV
jgi:hypothetical protein